MQNDKVLFYLNGTELLHESLLTCVYQFVKDNGISPLFSPEQRSQITSAVRADMAQSGLKFDKESAWDFFTR